MKSLNILILSAFFLTLSACEKDEKKLTYAKPYIVVGEQYINMTNNNRKAKIWFISADASSTDEFAQTAILAAFEKHKAHRYLDLIHIILVPDKDLMASSISYASAIYATDKKGLASVSGADQKTMTNFKWLVRAADKPLNLQEFEIAKLWYKHQSDFPSEDLLSSLSYNKEKLVKFIADSLDMVIEDVNLPQVILSDYTSLDFLNN